MQLEQSLAAQSGPVWADDAARFYLEGIEQSNYAQRVGGLLRDLLGDVSSLLDVGAGGGTLPASFLARSAHWTAVEPNAYLADALESLASREGFRLQVIRAVWQQLGQMPMAPHDAVLAASMCGPLEQPEAFWQLLAPLCKRRMVWSVPAQRGPRQACLSGALPAALHGEDETPAVELILERLPSSLQPHAVHVADWTFSYRFADFSAADAWFQQRFNPDSHASIAAALRTHLEQVAVSEEQAVTIHVPKSSACLVWDFQ